MELLASLLGFFIGLSLGAVGAGGSILAVPLLVFVVGLEAKEATTASLAIVGSVSLGGMLAHWRAGRVRLLKGVTFGAAGIAGSLGGSILNREADPDTLLFLFAGLMILAAWAMLRRRDLAPSATFSDLSPVKPAIGLRAAGPLPGIQAVAGGAGTTVKMVRRNLAVAQVILAGTTVGSITGFFGVGGGFVIVPALNLVLRMPIRQAVGTSLLVISVNSAVALIARLGAGDIPWGVIAPFTVAGLVGVAAGAFIADKTSTKALTRWFAGVILVVAAYTAIRTLAGL